MHFISLTLISKYYQFFVNYLDSCKQLAYYQIILIFVKN